MKQNKAALSPTPFGESPVRGTLTGLPGVEIRGPEVPGTYVLRFPFPMIRMFSLAEFLSIGPFLFGLGLVSIIQGSR